MGLPDSENGIKEQLQEQFLRLFAQNLAKVKYGLITEEPYQRVNLTNLRRELYGSRVEVAGQIRDLSLLFNKDAPSLLYQGVISLGASSLAFERAGYTVLGDAYKSLATSFEQQPFTADQYRLELKALRRYEGLVSMRGVLQGKGLLVERISGFEDVQKAA